MVPGAPDLTQQILDSPTGRAIRADRFLRKWRDDIFPVHAFEDPDNDPVIVQVTYSVASDDERSAWIAFVRGDGTDPHRCALADACSAQPFSVRAL